MKFYYVFLYRFFSIVICQFTKLAVTYYNASFLTFGSSMSCSSFLLLAKLPTIDIAYTILQPDL